MQQSLLLASVWPDNICMRSAVRGIVSDYRFPFISHLRFILDNELDNSSSFFFEPDPDAVTIRDYL